MDGTKGLVLGLVAGGAIGAGVVWAIAAPSGSEALDATPSDPATVSVPADELAALRSDAAAAAQLRADAEALQAEAQAAARLRTEADAQRQRADAAEAAVAELEAAAAKPATATNTSTAVAKTDTDGPFRFGIKVESPVFDQQDWPKLGGHCWAMIEKIPAFADNWIATGEPDMEAIREIMPHNMPLAQMTMAAQGEIEGHGMNGPFTHPAVMANLLRGALAAAELPLSESQESAIVSLGTAWGAEWAQLKARHDETTLEIAKMADEVDAKQRFALAVRGLLTPEQRDALFLPNVVDRLQLDLFSPVFVWQMRETQTGADADALTERLATRLLALAKAPDVEAATVRTVAERWQQALGDTWLAPVGDSSRAVHFPTVQRLQAQARAQVAAAQELIAMGLLTPEQATHLRGNAILVSPYLTQ